jgi:DNA replication and repair protein RecF
VLQRLELVDFRNFERAVLVLGPRFTVLAGHNGAGKTNALEAIWLLATLRSFRVAELAPLVRRGANVASVGVTVFDAALGLPSELSVRLTHDGGSARRLAFANGKLVRSAADFYGRVRAVLFTPEDLGVLRGGPAQRRQLVDRMLFARERAHIVDVQAYEKQLRSRNRVLRDDDLADAERERLLGAYEAGLAETGARIWTRRERLLAELRPVVGRAFARIHGGVGVAPADRGEVPEIALRHEVVAGPVPEAERQAALVRLLAERRGHDRMRGATTLGPHRDDIAVSFDGAPAVTIASQGQTRAIVLALKLAELDVARAALGTPPLLLLDDVSSELDPARTALMFEALVELAGQCVLTTTSPHHLGGIPADSTVRWRVEDGGLQPDPDAGSKM